MTDPNEIQAYLLVCQDEDALESFAKLCQERADLMQARRDKNGKAVKDDGKAFVNMSVHTAGGDRQPPMTGPASAVVGNTTMAEQAAINDHLLQHQAEEGRLSAKSEPQRLASLEGMEPASTDREEKVKEAAKEGKNPVVGASPGGKQPDESDKSGKAKASAKADKDEKPRSARSGK